jgi:hypothetical protein
VITVARSAALLDERSTPALRRVFGRFLASSRSADLAIRRVRIAGIDLSPAELGPLSSCRVLVSRLDAGALHDLPASRDAATVLHGLLRFVESGRLQVRAAPTVAWNPDFSLFHPAVASDPPIAVVGSHYFHEPDQTGGPALTTILTTPRAVALTERRFVEIWDSGYDVLPAVRSAIGALLSELS